MKQHKTQDKLTVDRCLEAL